MRTLILMIVAPKPQSSTTQHAQCERGSEMLREAIVGVGGRGGGLSYVSEAQIRNGGHSARHGAVQGYLRHLQTCANGREGRNEAWGSRSSWSSRSQQGSAMVQSTPFHGSDYGSGRLFMLNNDAGNSSRRATDPSQQAVTGNGGQLASRYHPGWPRALA